MDNWAGNLTYRATKIHYPRSVEEVAILVAGAGKVRALGTRHSFSHVADSIGGDLISTKHLDRVVKLDSKGPRPTVTVEAGVTYGQLSPILHREGFALHNLASLPHISVAGACATATHGSGDRNRILAAAVCGMEIVTADGSMRTLSGDALKGAVVGLGGLGVVTKVTLNLEPTYAMRQEVYQHLPVARMRAHFDDIVSSAYSVSLFTDWSSDNITQVWCKRRETDGAPALDLTRFGATPATADVHPLVHLSAENCTEQMGIPGPWHERLPHFRMGFTPSSGEELQTEYLIPRRHAVRAFDAVNDMRAAIAPLVHISEIRTIAADDLWMSPCYETDCIGLHFTWKKNWPAVKALLPKIEKQLEQCEPAPHWGKLFALPAAKVQKRYPRLNDFRELLVSFDPKGKFRNAFLDEFVTTSRGAP